MDHSYGNSKEMEANPDPESTSMELESIPADGNPVTIEVYHYPEDCILQELIEHFAERFTADCITPSDEIEMTGSQNNSFIMKFKPSGRPHHSYIW